MIDIGALFLRTKVDTTEVDNLKEELEGLEGDASKVEEQLSKIDSAQQKAMDEAARSNAERAQALMGLGDKIGEIGSTATSILQDWTGSAMDQETVVNRAGDVWGYYTENVLAASESTDDYMTQAEYLATVNEIGAKAMAKGAGQAAAFDIAQREMTASQKLAMATGREQGDVLGGLNSAFMGITGNLGNYTGGLYDNAAGLEQWARDAGIADESIESGTYSMEEQAQMVEFLATQLAGSGEAAETTAQKQAKLQANLEDIKATLGEELLPIIQKALDFITPIITKISDIPGPIKLIIAGVVGLVAVFGTVAPVILTIAAASLTLDAAMLPIIATVGAVIAVIALLVAGGIALYKNWDTIKEKASELWTALKEKFEAIKTSITTAWTTMVNSIKTKWEEFKTKVTGVIDTVKAAFEGFKTKVSTTIDNIKGFFSDLKTSVDTFLSPITGIIDGIKTAWSNLKTAMSHPIQAIVNTVQNAVPKRTGINYVPNDGYIASLHRGEMILTQQEAQQYREGTTSGGVTNNFNITVPTNPNAMQTALQLRDLIRREEYSYA